MDAGFGGVGTLVDDGPRGDSAGPGAVPAPGSVDAAWAEAAPPLPWPAELRPQSGAGLPPSRAGTAVAPRGVATAAILGTLAVLLGLATAVAGSPSHRPLHVAGTRGPLPPVTAAPVTAPPLTAPPVTAPPVTAPPPTAPRVTAPPLTAPRVTAPPVTAPPITAPPAGGTPAGVPAEVATVAQGIIAALDQRLPPSRQIPATADNITLLGRWMAMEGGLWADNPLNTDLHAGQFPHQISSSGQDTGTPIYPTMQIGIDNAAATLVGSGAYAPILAQLHSGSAACPAFASAVIRSPWAASHYGHDPAAFCGASPGAALGVHGKRGGAHRHSGPRKPAHKAKA